MAKQVIRLSQDADLIIDAPVGVSSSSHPLVVARAIHQECSNMAIFSPSTRAGALSVKIGSAVYRVQYELKINRMMNALTVYSEAIRYIEVNIHRYDPYLAQVAIETLRECHRAVLRQAR